MKIAIIGAGLTGLVAGYRLSQKGNRVTIFEKSDDIGGLMGGFKIGGTSLEKAYHHIFRTDTHIIELARELGLLKKLKWYKSKTGLYYNGDVYPFAGAMDLLKFKPLNLLSKIRLGLVKIWLEKDYQWHKYENVTAVEWMRKWCGRQAYEVIWEPLLKGKFHNYYDKVAMSWLWARIHTRANSKDRDGVERLGYFTGGFKIIADELAKRIKENNGTIELNTQVDFNNIENEYDRIIYTGAAKGVDYIGAVCLIFTSKQSLSRFYWHNINDTKSPFLAFLQHTNLVGSKQYSGKQVYYIGTYVPHEHRYFVVKDEEIIREWFAYLKNIFPDFNPKKVNQKWLFKFKNAQHIVTKNYRVPESKTREKIYQANFAQVYPEDRGTNFAVREGEKVAALILQDQDLRKAV